MAIEPLTESIVVPDTAVEPEPAEPAEPARSRRSVIGAGLAGLAGLVLGSLGRPLGADAAAGGSLVMGSANSAGTSSTSLTTASTGTALLVTQTGAGTALRGSATAVDGIAGFFTSANGPGVSGVTANNTKYAVYGGNNAATTGSGAAMRAAGEQNHGLVATTASASAHAIKAINTNAGTGSSAGAGIRALSGGGTDADIDGLGVWHAAGEFCGATGVVAVGTSVGYGVSAHSDLGTAVYAQTVSGYSVYSDGNSLVNGALEVTGTLSKGGGSFKIDHPLDPANKFLYHSFVESPDMKNVYDGVVTLDAKGEATVTLPDWFEALNRDFRYQLTAMGQAAPDLHVKRELAEGVFSIAGGKAGQRVSWQLTGIRQDAWASAHRIPVEADKSAGERGLYLHPTENGQPAARGIEAVRNTVMRPHVGK
jgi:hypothetical protein